MEASNYKNILVKIGILASPLLLAGCNFALLDPKGAIGEQNKELIITAILLMLIVVIPVIVMTLYFAYKYRASNTDQEYTPDWSHSSKIEFVVWAVPIIIIIILATITWRTTHELEPGKPLPGDQPTLTIQVVSMDWKWLFIYPDQNIATINEVVFPKNVPVKFELTADNIMNSFFIPQLGSQLYAMPAMVTRLHLIANHAGSYDGISASYSGEGFSDMKFTAIAVEDEQSFNDWIAKVKQSDQVIQNFEDYRQLATPSINEPVRYFSEVSQTLFADVVTQYEGGMNMHHGMSSQGHMPMTEQKQTPMNMSESH